MKFIGLSFLATCFIIVAKGQYVGIGVANPQKGKLEIAGALGNQTTVLTVGSDGTGISLQRNWPTIGFNQYRDAGNVQRFIGNGHAGSIYLSATDGSIVFTQFGQGTANALITTTTYPFFIEGNGNVNITKQLHMGSNVKLTTAPNGLQLNMLPFAFGSVRSDGVKTGGTSNFTSSLVPGNNNAYYLQFSESITSTALVVTPGSNGARFATVFFVNDNTYGVRIFDKDGISQTNNVRFDFIMYKY